MQMKNAAEKARMYKALGEPIRLRILDYLLRKGKCTCICELSGLLKRDKSVIFRHITVLRNAGMIVTKKEAKYLFCCVTDKDKVKRLLED